MTFIPSDPVSVSDNFIYEWNLIKSELNALRNKEAAMRRRIFDAFFTEEEGVTYYELGHGYKLKAEQNFDRKIDETALKANSLLFLQSGINLERIVRYKAEIAIGEYRKLSEENKKLFDTVLTTKPGLPQLSIIKPKVDK